MAEQETAPTGKPIEILDQFKEPLWESDKRFIVLQGGAGSGKMVASFTKIVTPSGYKTIEDIQKGDTICNVNGGITKVIGKYDNGVKDTYKITFEDGRSCIAGPEHLWNYRIDNKVYKTGERWKVATTEQIIEMMDAKKDNTRRKNFYIPIADAVYFLNKGKDLFDPYLIGLMLGDGHISYTLNFTTGDAELKDYMLNKGYTKKVYLRKNCKSEVYQMNLKKELIKEFLKVGLCGKNANSKFIPDCYKFTSKENRYQLLRGLLDTDGTCDKGGRIGYCTVSERLANDVAWLVRSLGGKCTISTKTPHYTYQGEHKEGQLAYILYIRFKDISVPVFNLKRKQDLVKPRNGGKLDMGLKIESIVPYGKERCYCIAVDSPDSLYMIDDFIVTHNTHAVCQRVCYRFLTEPNLITLVVRGTMPALRKSIYMGDPSIVRMLSDWGVPISNWLNKTENKIINPDNRSEIWFIGLDDPEKIKSQNINLCVIEEATELSLEKWVQLNTRLRRPNDNNVPNQMYIMYNPISIYNWVLQLFVVNPSQYIKDNTLLSYSTFIDNPKASKENVLGWLDTAERDENYYWTYIVGKPGVPVGQIYPNFKFTPRNGVKDEKTGEYLVDPWPDGVWKVKPYYGIDWGFVDPTVIAEIREFEKKVYIVCRLYKTEMTMAQIVQRLHDIGADGSSMIYCDSAEKDRINELSIAGFCPNKAAKSIHAGIVHLRQCDVIIDSTGEYGEAARTEIDAYSLAKDPNDSNKYLDEPDSSTPNHFCVAEGTLVTTETGTVPIENIKVGDKVMTRKGAKAVTAWSLTNASATVMVIGTADSKLLCTPDHRIWSKTWRCFVEARYIKQNEYVQIYVDANTAKPAKVLVTALLEKKRTVYDITVEDEHEFYADGILVSNCDAIRYGKYTKYLYDTNFSTAKLDLDEESEQKERVKKIVSSKDMLAELQKYVTKL